MSRCGGYFNDSELSSLGRPADEREKALLAPFPGAVAPDVMDGTYRPTVNDGSGGDRKVLREALEELQAAGYELRGNALVNTATGEPLAFEILVTTKEDERLALAYQRTLDRSASSVDDPHRRLRPVPAAAPDIFDYDMIRYTWAGVAVARQRAALPLEPGVGRRRAARSTMPAPSSRRSTP